MSKWSSAYRDSRWQQKRLEIMKRDNWTCRSCGAKGEGVTLNVHHAYYESGKAPWEYDDDVLITWCEDCHGFRHDVMKETSRHLTQLDLSQFNELTTVVVNSSGYTTTALGRFMRLSDGGDIEAPAVVLNAICDLVKVNVDLQKESSQPHSKTASSPSNKIWIRDAYL